MRIRSAPGSRASRPSNSSVPAVGRTKPATALSSVDLPQPEGPRRTNFSPRRTWKETSRTASTTPAAVVNWIDTRLASISVSCAAMAMAALLPRGVPDLGDGRRCPTPTPAATAPPRPSHRMAPALVPRQPLDVAERELLPRGGDAARDADLLEERGELHQTVRRHRVLDLGVPEERAHEPDVGLLRLGEDFGRILAVPVEKPRRLIERPQQGTVDLRVLLGKVVHRPHHVEGVRSADDLVAIEELVDAGDLQLQVLIRRRGQVRGDLPLGDEREHPVGMGHRDHEAVERVRVAQLLLRGHLEHDLLDAANRGHRDLVGRLEVPERLDLGPVGVEVERHLVERRDDLPGDAAIPGDDERSDPAAPHVYLAGQHRVPDHRYRAQLQPLHLEAGHPALEDLALLDDEELAVADAGLDRDAQDPSLLREQRAGGEEAGADEHDDRRTAQSSHGGAPVTTSVPRRALPAARGDPEGFPYLPATLLRCAPSRRRPAPRGLRPRPPLPSRR